MSNDDRRRPPGAPGRGTASRLPPNKQPHPTFTAAQPNTESLPLEQLPPPTCPKCGTNAKTGYPVVVDAPLTFGCPSHNCGHVFEVRLTWVVKEAPRTAAQATQTMADRDDIVNQLVHVLECYAHTHIEGERVTGCPVCRAVIQVKGR